MEPHIVNADPRYAKAALIEPSPHGFILVAATVRPGPLPITLPSRARSQLLAALKELARQLEQLDAVVQTSVFRATVMPPTARQSAYLRDRGSAIHVPNFDAVVLIETTSPDVIRDVQAAPIYSTLLSAVQNASTSTYVLDVRNVKRVGDVDRTRKGLYLFNYFVAEDTEVGLEVWDYLAGWYTAETGLTNSVVLLPLAGEPSDYAFINHARWDISLPRFLWRQLSTKSFRTYVLANLDENHVGSMPVLYRLA